MNNKNLKDLAEESLLRSMEEVSSDKEIIQLLKDKVIIIKENNKVEVKYADNRPLIRIPLYLTGKFVGFKILKLFDTSAATIEELSENLNLPPKALSRPLGTLMGDIIEKSQEGYKIRAFRILDFLKSLDSKSPVAKINSLNKKSKKDKKIEEEAKLNFNKNGLANLSEYLNIPEEKIKKVLFFRENDVNILDIKFAPLEIIERQVYCTLMYLISYKYCFDLEKLPAGLLRKKLKLLGIKSLVNLSSNLHNFPELIIHEAGPRGSQNNFYIITHIGETKIKEKLKEYLESEKK